MTERGVNLKNISRIEKGAGITTIIGVVIGLLTVFTLLLETANLGQDKWAVFAGFVVGAFALVIISFAMIPLLGRIETRVRTDLQEKIDSSINSATFIASYTTLYLGLLIFIFLPKAFITSEQVLSFWNSYAGMYFLLPFGAGIYGFYRVIRAQALPQLPPLILLSIGLIFWSIGQALWVWYNIFGQVEIPYPSFADYGYFMCGLLWLWGTRLIRSRLQISRAARWTPSAVSIFMIVIHSILIFLARNGNFAMPEDPIKTILDYYYPTVAALNLGVLLICVFSTSSDGIINARLNRALRWILVGTTSWYIADTGFSITTSLPESHSWTFTSGNWVDFTFATAFWIVGIGIALFPVIVRNENNN